MPQPDSSREMGSGNILGRVMILQAWSGRLRGGDFGSGNAQEFVCGKGREENIHCEQRKEHAIFRERRF